MVKRMPHTQRSTISGINMSTYIKRKRSASTLPRRLASDCNFPSLSHSKCLSVWLIVSLCFYLAVFPTPRWSSVSSSLSLSIPVHPLLIYYEYHNICPLRGPFQEITHPLLWHKRVGAFITPIRKRRQHTIASVVSRGGGAGCMWVCARVHLTHITHRLPNI